MEDPKVSREEIDAYVERVWPEVLEDIATLVAIDSVEDLSAAAPGAPWGPGPKAGLDAALNIAERLGLDAHDVEGYIGYADLPGRSERQVATIAHVDIVPVGTGWDTDPLTLTVRDGYLLGRGTLDDKGPLALTLWAAHFFKERGQELPYTLRCIVGANEETGLGDVDYYNEHFEQPAFLFTPDAEFPVCCGEKGGFSATYTSGPVAGGTIVDFKGGTAGNAIPDLAEVTVRADAALLPAAEGIDVEDAGDGLARLVAHGKGGHASLPEGTVNAIGMLVDYLWDNGLYSEEERPFLELERLIFATTDGSSLGIDATDDIFEPLTCIGGTVEVEDGRFRQTIDARFPKSTTAEHLEEVLSKLGEEHGCTLTVDLALVPFYVDPSSPEIQTLIQTYNEHTGKDKKPFTIGGGTYARDFENAASFGPEETDMVNPDWVGGMHGPNEGVSEQLLRDSLSIYIDAIARLMELDL